MPNRMGIFCLTVAVCLCSGCGGGFWPAKCHQPPPFSISAVKMSPGGDCEPQGIPYYLPKPLLVVAKNFRYLDDAKIGLTRTSPIPNSFDNQSSYADIAANISEVSGGTGGTNGTNGSNGNDGMDGEVDTDRYKAVDVKPALSSGGTDSFFTYQVVMVPDLSQKYGLRVSGGPGEVRASMNIVNGWMYTGMGPFYLKDSSTAQNRLAKGVGNLFTGRAAADVLDSVGDLVTVGGASNPADASGAMINAARLPTLDSGDFVKVVSTLTSAIDKQTQIEMRSLNYAEIYIYEPELTPDGQMTWELIAEHHMDRVYTGNSAEGATMLKSLLSDVTIGSIKATTEEEAEMTLGALKVQAESYKTALQIKEETELRKAAVPVVPSQTFGSTSLNAGKMSGVQGGLGQFADAATKTESSTAFSVQARGQGVQAIQGSNLFGRASVPAESTSQSVSVNVEGDQGRRRLLNRLFRK